MCGICGVVRWDGVNQTHVHRALAMRGLLEHRGPDDKSAEVDERAALAATRLSIRGSEAGHQPLRDPATGVLASCNGEIDNHRHLRRWLEARGHEVAAGSDMAILPYLYEEHGERFVEELEGPFALALWDPRSGLLLLARDRAGERPLFYVERDDEVVFATELSALALDSGKGCCLDERALRHYLRFGRFPAPLSPVPAIRKLAPAEVMCFREKSVERRRYWRWSMGTLPKREPSLDAFDRVFREAVERQTDCDVRFGMFLSGGVDSSLVAAVARQIHPERRLLAYTLRFGEASYDEGPAAAAVADRLGLENETVWVRAEDFPPKIRELVRLTGEPLGDPAWVPTALLAQRAAKDIKVVLVGEGGDEVFGGYPTYVGARLAAVYERLPSVVRLAFSRVVRRWPPSDRKVALSFLLKRFVEGSGMEPLARHLLWTSVIPPAVLERLGCQPSELDTDFDRASGTATGLDALQLHDLESYLAEGLLTKADRASMGWALEPRAPYLDRKVLDFAATLPASERVRGLGTKVFLKRYALRYLPRSVVHQRKRGLSVPLAAWLRGPLRAWARERLASGRLRHCGVQTEAVLEVFREHVEREADWGRALWSLLVLTEWLEWWETSPSESA